MSFWKEIVICQICSGSLSFAASAVIVTFLALNGLDTPYRRIIFGLSISDMCQSFAILAGPWLTRSDVPQALWGVGNKYTCRFDGFIYGVGNTAVPMYTVFLCVYYVCKLKGRMTNTQFSLKIERMMHIAIIGINLGLNLTALGMDTINPTFFGNFCLTANVPTGCNQHPEIFGECDLIIKPAVDFFVIVFAAIVPILSLVGIMICMAVIFWNVLMREKIFGRSNASGATGISSGHRRRNRRLRLPASSDRSSSDQEMMGNPTDRPKLHDALGGINDEEGQTGNKSPHQMNPLDEKYITDIPKDAIKAQDDTNKEESKTSGFGSASGATRLQQDAAVQNTSGLPSVISSNSKNDLSPTSSAQEQRENHDHGSDLHRSSQQHHQPTEVGGADIVDVEALSRLYKKELLTQACCYVIAFCLTTMPFLVINLKLINGIVPSKNSLRAVSVLYPLVGLFNVIIYTRWNVGSWRRKHPECSRLQAFWLVLKTGGDLPNEDEWNETSAWNFGCSCYRKVSSTSVEVEQPGDHGGQETDEHPLMQVPFVHQNPSLRTQQLAPFPDSSSSHLFILDDGEDLQLQCHKDRPSSTPQTTNRLDEIRLKIIPKLQHQGIPFTAKPLVSSLNSAIGMNGMSASFDEEDNLCYRSKDDWRYVKGEASVSRKVNDGSEEEDKEVKTSAIFMEAQHILSRDISSLTKESY